MSNPQQTTEAPPKIKANSLRDSLAKTVRLLTSSGIDVQFRGHQPMVLSKGNKAVRLVLPEINDDASKPLLEAIQGYLDHEVGHIFYTPFARAARIGATHPKAGALANIIEDIRLEKLLPRDLPGTRENLERMYEKFIPTMIDPAVQENIATGDPGKCFTAVLVPGMRALSGQKAFQAYMDVNNYWQHLRPLIVKMPLLAARLRSLETFDDVESLVEDMIAAMAPPPPPPRQEAQESQHPEDERDDEKDDDAPANPQFDEDDNEEGDDDEEGGGEGHGDGSGTDDEEGDDDDRSCSGDGDEGGDDSGDDSGDTDDVGIGTIKPDSTDEASKQPGSGTSNVSLTDALKQLDPKQRRALFMYKNRNATVDAIATDLDVDANTAVDLLRNGRRRLREIMKGRN